MVVAASVRDGRDICRWFITCIGWTPFLKGFLMVFFLFREMIKTFLGRKRKSSAITVKMMTPRACWLLAPVFSRLQVQVHSEERAAWK